MTYASRRNHLLLPFNADYMYICIILWWHVVSLW